MLTGITVLGCFYLEFLYVHVIQISIKVSLNCLQLCHVGDGGTFQVLNLILFLFQMTPSFGCHINPMGGGVLQPGTSSGANHGLKC